LRGAAERGGRWRPGFEARSEIPILFRRTWSTVPRGQRKNSTGEKYSARSQFRTVLFASTEKSYDGKRLLWLLKSPPLKRVIPAGAFSERSPTKCVGTQKARKHSSPLNAGAPPKGKDAGLEASGTNYKIQIPTESKSTPSTLRKPSEGWGTRKS